MISNELLDVINQDYAPAKFDRAIVEKHSSFLRGSVRLMCGLYRTDDEEDAYIRDGLALKLPGYPGYSYS